MKKLLLILLVSGTVYAQKKFVADKQSSSVKYFMSHPMHDWDAINKDIVAVMVYNVSSKVISQCAVTMKVNGFDSGNSNRDSHAVEVLESLKFPSITFSSSEITRDQNKLVMRGKLTFHGITKILSITGTTTETDNLFTFNGDLKILLSDFNIAKPTLMGVAAKDEVNIKIVSNFKLN